MRKNPKFSLQSHLTTLVFHAIVELYNLMLKKLALVSSWLLVTPAIILALGLSLTLHNNSKTTGTIPATALAEVELEVNNNIDGQVLGAQIGDLRPYIVARFLNGTPLEPYSAYIVEISDKYGIDFRLIPAIAMKESGGGSAIDLASHNAWGFENGKTYFDSWETGIDTVGKTLKKRYIAKGLVTPDQIMAVYAPPQLETGGKWARDVNLFFSQMESL